MAYGVVGVPSGSGGEIIDRKDTTSEVEPNFGETFTAIDEVTTDEYGHVLGVNTKTITMPYETDFEKCSPSTIQTVVKNGQAANYWSVGDSTPITVNGTVGIYEFQNDTFYAFIIGFDHNAEIEGENTLHLQFGKRADGTAIAFCDDNYASEAEGFRMNTTYTNVGGWKDSLMRTDLCEQFFNILPTSWQNVIAECTKYTDNVGGGSGQVAANVTATQDKIFLFNATEVGFENDSDNLFNKNENDYTKIYEYYKTVNTERYLMMQPDIWGLGFDFPSIFWLRSPYPSDARCFCIVLYDGTLGYGDADYSIAFAPAFVIS